MPHPPCRKRGLTLGRRLLSDALHFARPQYLAAAERLMKVPDVIAAQRQSSPRPSWGAIMTKAFALAARHHPQMRQVYFEFPWGHLGEYESQVGCVVVTRRLAEEDAVFLAPLPSPENQSLQALDTALRRYQHAPIEEISAYRDAIRIARLPRILSRLVLWLILQVAPRRRVKHFGTFCVTTMSPFGAKTVSVPTLASPVLHYGAITEAGEIPVGLVVDHRVMDGAVVGYTLLEMEQVLRHEIHAELLALNQSTLAA